MDLPRTITVKDFSASFGSLFAFAIVAILITSGTVSDDALAASGIVTEFVGAGDFIQEPDATGALDTTGHIRLYERPDVFILYYPLALRKT